VQRSIHIAGQNGNHQPKSRIMKLSKALLAAMLTGITLQGVQSCTKDKDEPSKEQKEKEKEKEGENKPKTYPNNCPACGMG
jgi:anaerobic selenocysteine-containing dehydrogenase